MSTIKSSDKNSSILHDRLPIEKVRSVSPVATSIVTATFGNPNLARSPNHTPRPQPIHTVSPTPAAPLYAPIPQQQRVLPNPETVPYVGQYNYLPQQVFQYATQPYLANNFQHSYVTYNPSLSHAQSLPVIPVNTQPVYGGIPYAPPSYPSASMGNLYSNIVGLKEPRQSQRRITYHPYQRAFIDYEQRVVVVPVEKTRTKYYEKVYQTEYIPKPVEQVVIQTVPVQKQTTKVQYIPVEKKIIHFPKDQRMYTIVDENIRNIKTQAQLQAQKNIQNQTSVNNLNNFSQLKNENTKVNEIHLRPTVQSFGQSRVQQVYSSQSRGPEITINPPK